MLALKMCRSLKLTDYFYISVLSLFVDQALQSYLSDNFPADVLEEAYMSVFQMVKKYHYPVESHFVTTKDNYIVQVHRIRRDKGKPVFLMHGVLDSSSSWVIMRPWSGLGYYLYENGYDVWMGNARGNKYSINHTTLDPNRDEAYWIFSWHEIGYYDLPAVIDYVLNLTGFSKLSYIGHSQGTTVFFVMASMRPEYNKKITLMSALAPSAFIGNVPNSGIVSLHKILTPFRFIVQRFLNFRLTVVPYCYVSRQTEDACFEILWSLIGRDPEGNNRTMFPSLATHFPSGASTYQLEHYAQIVQSKRFQRFDYGTFGNMQRYGQPTPPDYPLKNITAPIALYYSYNDLVCTVEGVQRLAKMLPNVVENRLFPYKNWNHITIIWGSKARQLAHVQILELMKKFEN